MEPKAAPKWGYRRFASAAEVGLDEDRMRIDSGWSKDIYKQAKRKLNRVSGRSYEGLETLDHGFRELSRAKNEVLIVLGYAQMQYPKWLGGISKE